MDEPPLPTGTVTFLFTDIERSTDLVRQLGTEFGSVRAAHHGAIRAALAEHGGHEIDTAGKGFSSRSTAPGTPLPPQSPHNGRSKRARAWTLLYACAWASTRRSRS